MPAKGANNCVKIFLMLVNCVFLAIGGVVFGTGVYLYASDNVKNYADLISEVQDLQSLRVLLIGCGAIIMLIALCGCIGACFENRCLMIVYCIFLCLLLLGNIVSVVMSVVYTKQIRNAGVEKVRTLLKNNYGNATTETGRRITQAADNLQRAAKCCGWSGAENKNENIFKSTPWFEVKNKDMAEDEQFHLPKSCCLTNNHEQCMRNKDLKDARLTKEVHSEDCIESLLAMNGCFLRAVLAAVISAIVLQVICVTCACVMVRQVSNSEGTVV